MSKHNVSLRIGSSYWPFMPLLIGFRLLELLLGVVRVATTCTTVQSPKMDHNYHEIAPVMLGFVLVYFTKFVVEAGSMGGLLGLPKAESKFKLQTCQGSAECLV